MADATSLVVPATGLIYKLNEDGTVKTSPSINWSFELTLKDDETITEFINRVKDGYGIRERCHEIGVKSFTTKLAVKDPKPSQEFPKGRVFSIDTNEQWQLSYPKIHKEERHLMGKFLT